MKVVTVVAAILLQQSLGQVTLQLVNEQTCSGENLTFSCGKVSGTGLLVWTITALPGVPGITDAFGQFLQNNTATNIRITSSDSSPGPNPTSVTILTVTAADNGAAVQCRIANGASSQVIALAIRPPECSLTVDATAVTDTSITVMLTWTNCMGAEPSNISLRLSPATAQDPTVISSVRYDVSGLIPNTDYSITASFTDACGSISAMTVTVTLSITNPANNGLIAGACVAGGLIAVALAVIVVVVVAIVCKLKMETRTQRTPPSTADVINTSQYDEVEMTENPAYHPIATTVDYEPQYI